MLRYPKAMQLEDGPTEDIVKRLRRVEGQIGGVIRMLQDGRECADVVTQIAAARRALDRAGFKLLSSGMQQCLAGAADGSKPAMTTEQMERMFLSLA